MDIHGISGISSIFPLKKGQLAFGQAIEAPGPRVAYAEGLARAVLCEAGI